MDKKTHTMKQDADLVRGEKQPKEVNLHKALHPDDRKSGKGVKESRQFRENCSFNVTTDK